MTASEDTKVNEDLIIKSAQAHDQADNVKPFKREWVWRNIILMLIVHLSATHGFFLAIYTVSWKTFLFTYFLTLCCSFGIQVGAHRLWCHRTFKAKLPLQIMLMILDTLALENDIYEWSRDHRVHHKYSDTDADPHNSKNGFFFSHIGWLLSRKHPEVMAKGKTINMSDLDKDPVIQFQRSFYIPLVILIWGVLPTYLPHYLWGETIWNAWFSCVMFRYAVVLNITWCVNSAAHLWGMKPYDKSIVPVETTIKNYLFGEGFHNYHHTFPWDYSASEFGWGDVFNPATAFIDFFAQIGWAYDLKKASRDVIESRQQKTGEPVMNRKSVLMERVTGVIVFMSPIWIRLILSQSIWYAPVVLVAIKLTGY